MTLHHFSITKPDSRSVHFFSRQPFPEGRDVLHFGLTRSPDWTPPTLRVSHLTGERVSVSAARQNRPHLPNASSCPLCPASPASSPAVQASVEAPSVSFAYDWIVFENLYPALWLENQTGHCEVIVYTKAHEGSLGALPLENLEGLIEVWQHRSLHLGERDDIECVFLFENRGAEIGVTLHHPHGQIYAFNHTPPRLAAELDYAERYYAQNMTCLICDVAADHSRRGDLLLHAGEHIIVFMPEAPKFPYEVHITTRQHRTHIERLTEPEVKELAVVLKKLVAAYDRLFNFPLPYIMQHHQCPSHARGHHSFHWNIQFTPFHRSADKLKYLAGAETGMGFFVNDSLPEEKVKELRAVWEGA
jgi:UDPglucose--hexose-1-phosphate uridylyltransferase